MKLVIASRNRGKIEELARILAIVAPDVELVGSDQFPDLSDVEETGETFAANALLKARTIARETGLPAIADDSGLCVDALNGAPGIYSARWSGVHGDDRANLEKVLLQLKEVSNEIWTMPSVKYFNFKNRNPSLTRMGFFVLLLLLKIKITKPKCRSF